MIYYHGHYIQKDIQKGVHYLKLSAGQKNKEALTLLGFYYLKYEIDVNKAIHYFTLASYQNDRISQYCLGLFYLMHNNIKKGAYYIQLSANNGYIEAHLVIGCLYHEGIYFERDIEKAIHYYKNASSFNNKCAKNNLGIIYKNGFEDIVPKKIGLAIEYFNEAIIKKKDQVAMFNLANIYLYDENIKTNVDMAIDLLVQSAIIGFKPSIDQLLVILIDKFGMKKDFIKNEISKNEKLNEIKDLLLNKITNNQMIIDYKNSDFVYNFMKIILPNKHMMMDLKVKSNSKDDMKKIDVSPQFYEGFGIDLLNI